MLLIKVKLRDVKKKIIFYPKFYINIGNSLKSS